MTNNCPVSLRPSTSITCPGISSKSPVLLLIPGHVMLVLGRSDTGQLFVIHSVNGLSYYQQNGQYYQSKLNGVSITPLLPLQLNRDTSYLQALYNIKSLTQETYAYP